jgi:O6-methylguanine-DNA--protein-cysteine methyltransferase
MQLNAFELPLDISGGDFEKMTLTAVRSIPVRKRATLHEITQMIGASQESTRYVAKLCAVDVFAMTVPWHRM